MSAKKNNTINIPEARAAMDKFKMEAANDRGVFSPQKIRTIIDKMLLETLIYIGNACKTGVSSLLERIWNFHLYRW